MTYFFHFPIYPCKEFEVQLSELLTFPSYFSTQYLFDNDLIDKSKVFFEQKKKKRQRSQAYCVGRKYLKFHVNVIEKVHRNVTKLFIYLILYSFFYIMCARVRNNALIICACILDSNFQETLYE